MARIHGQASVSLEKCCSLHVHSMSSDQVDPSIDTDHLHQARYKSSIFVKEKTRALKEQLIFSFERLILRLKLHQSFNTENQYLHYQINMLCSFEENTSIKKILVIIIN